MSICRLNRNRQSVGHFLLAFGKPLVGNLIITEIMISVNVFDVFLIGQKILALHQPLPLREPDATRILFSSQTVYLDVLYG